MSSWDFTVRFYTVVERCVVWECCESDASTLVFFCMQLPESGIILDLKRLWWRFILIGLPNICHIVHILRLKIPHSFGDWICLRLQVERGEVQPAESHVCCNSPMSESCTFKYTTRAVHQSRAEEVFLSPFHLSMDSDHNFSHNYYWFYTFLGWNLSLLCGTEMVTQRSCSQGYATLKKIQGPP